MLKHRFNIFPEMQPEDYERLKHDIDVNDYDVRSPIWFYEGAILDGWNRERACKEYSLNWLQNKNAILNFENIPIL